MIVCGRNTFISILRSGSVKILGSSKYDFKKVLSRGLRQYTEDLMLKVEQVSSYEGIFIQPIIPVFDQDRECDYTGLVSCIDGVPSDFVGVKFSYSDKIKIRHSDKCVNIYIDGNKIQRAVKDTTYHNPARGYRTSYYVVGNTQVGVSKYTVVAEVLELPVLRGVTEVYEPAVVIYYAVNVKGGYTKLYDTVSFPLEQIGGY